MRDFRLYVILDADICKKARGDIVEIADRVIAGGADILQLRAKGLREHKIKEISLKIKGLAEKAKALFVLNDQVDLAATLDLDGVHLGQEDLPVKEARKILGEDKIVGLSTHSLEQASAAQKQEVDYIGIGPIFSTATKPNVTPIGLEIIVKIKDKIKIPFVAIGGIGLDNLDQVLSNGAQRVAVCRAIIESPDILKAAKEFRQRLYQ
ncbi:MAG: thiamine phosphate synthase [Omnitrophica bacterium]|nr:thiamine phosphate synthase [Candidatus Omnitrophota bacterium]